MLRLFDANARHQSVVPLHVIVQILAAQCFVCVKVVRCARTLIHKNLYMMTMSTMKMMKQIVNLGNNISKTISCHWCANMTYYLTLNFIPCLLTIGFSKKNVQIRNGMNHSVSWKPSILVPT